MTTTHPEVHIDPELQALADAGHIGAQEAIADLYDLAAQQAHDSDTEPPEDYYGEGPCCSVCDGLGHGYPGGGPCPLEESGSYDYDPPEPW